MNVFKDLYEAAINIKEKDPACRNVLEAIILYPGFHILVFHRIAHFFYKHIIFVCFDRLHAAKKEPSGRDITWRLPFI